MVLGTTEVSAGNNLLKWTQLAVFSVILPLAVLRVVSLEQLVDQRVKLAVQVAYMSVCLIVQLDHQVVDKPEVMQVVDLLLFNGCLEDFSPDLRIVPANVVKLLRQVEEGPLVESNFFLP